MAAVSHGARHLRQGIGVSKLRGTSRSIHIPALPPRPAPSTAQRIFSDTRTFFSRLASHLFTPGPSHSSFVAQLGLVRPAQSSNSQSISSRFSLPVKHALARPFSAPRLPKPPVAPANVTQVGLGTARAFHSGRPIFQNMVDNVPVATRALWEVEWDLKMKQKEARRMRRVAQSRTVPKSKEMLKPKPKPIVAEPQCGPSELDIYFPVQHIPDVTTHLLVPLAPTPTARLPLSARNDGGNVHPLLPIADLASIHANHRLHSLRVSTLFARLDAANVWDDPRVNVDAYAFVPRHGLQDVQGKQCTVLRVTFKGWNASRVRSVLGDNSQEWYSLEESNLDGRPTLLPPPERQDDVHMNVLPEAPSLGSSEVGLTCTSGDEMEDRRYMLSPPIRADDSAQGDLVFPTLDFSSAFSDAVDNPPPPPPPVVFLRTVSELIRDVELAPQSSSPSDSECSWEHLNLDSSVGERRWSEVTQDM